MPTSEEYLIFVKDQMERLGNISIRRMFGGAGIYCERHFFAIVVEDVLYFKVDDSNRQDYQAAGMEPFAYTTDHKQITMNYYEVPIDILENKDRLRIWAQKAIRAAQAAKKRKKTSKKK
jgi:DNA transformation protein